MQSADTPQWSPPQRGDVPADDRGPGHVHRGHRGELGGDPAVVGAVDRLPVQQRGVHEVAAGQQARRGDRDHLHQQADQGGADDGVADPAEVRPAPPPDPEQEQRHPVQVGEGVERVHRLDQPAVRQDQGLQLQLVGQVQQALQILHPVGVGVGAVDPGADQPADELPQPQQRHHHGELAGERAQQLQPTTARGQREAAPDQGEEHGAGGRQLPAGMQVGHRTRQSDMRARVTRFIPGRSGPIRIVVVRGTSAGRCAFGLWRGCRMLPFRPVAQAVPRSRRRGL